MDSKFAYLENIIDKNKLEIDYTSLIKNKIVTENDLRYLFLELNLTLGEVSNYTKTDTKLIRSKLKEFGVEKSKEMHLESKRKYFRNTIGVDNPFQLKSSQEKMTKTLLEKYGVNNASELQTVKDKRKKTCLEKYGVENPAQSEGTKEKVKQTCMEKYGTEHWLHNEEQKEKFHILMQEKLGAKSPLGNSEIKEKQRQTMLKKYGEYNPMQVKELKEKQRNKCFENYNVDNPMKNQIVKDKLKKTMIEKYGVDNPLKCSEIKQKVKNTCLEKYGVDNPTKNLDVQNKIIQTNLEKFGKEYAMQNVDLQEKVKQTNKEKYGVDWCLCNLPNNINASPEQIKIWQSRLKEIKLKQYNTKKKNNTFNSSRTEKMILKLLGEKFDKVVTQYKNDKYPFACDFYLPCVDLYIEYQGFISHGGCPYIGNEKQKLIVEEWKRKSDELNALGKKKELYLNMIHTWTISDVKKRNWAKEYHLNWIEFFNMDQFMEWYNTI